MSGLISGLQDHLSELIRGQELPLPALDYSHVELILELLQQAYTGIKRIILPQFLAATRSISTV